MFDYKSDKLTGFEENSSIIKKGYFISDVNFESPFNRTISSYLIVPNIPGKHPAVIFLHPGQGNRETFLAEAELLAAKGFVSLLLDVPFLQGDFTQNIPLKQTFTKTIESLVDIEQYIQIVNEIRRAIDLLCCHEKVDENRIAYVGHSFGAAWGGVLAGIENRIKSYILISGYAKASEWYLTSDYPAAAIIRTFLPPERFDFFIINLRRFDAVHFIKNAAPASVYFQFAHHDEFVDRAQADDFFSAASFPKKLSAYQTDHLFANCAEALHDRVDWLCKQMYLAKDFLKESS